MRGSVTCCGWDAAAAAADPCSTGWVPDCPGDEADDEPNRKPTSFDLIKCKSLWGTFRRVRCILLPLQRQRACFQEQPTIAIFTHASALCVGVPQILRLFPPFSDVRDLNLISVQVYVIEFGGETGPESSGVYSEWTWAHGQGHNTIISFADAEDAEQYALVTVQLVTWQFTSAAAITVRLCAARPMCVSRPSNAVWQQLCRAFLKCIGKCRYLCKLWDQGSNGTCVRSVSPKRLTRFCELHSYRCQLEMRRNGAAPPLGARDMTDWSGTELRCVPAPHTL